MKKIWYFKKLRFVKETITNLDHLSMCHLYGGGIAVTKTIDGCNTGTTTSVFHSVCTSCGETGDTTDKTGTLPK